MEHKHSWIWVVLSLGCKRVHVMGIDAPEVAEYLRASGLSVIPAIGGSTPVDALIVSPAAITSELREALKGPPKFVALALDGFPVRSTRPSRWRYWLRLMGSPAIAVVVRVRAGRATRAVQGVGLQAQVVPTGDRSSRYVVGRGSWQRLRRLSAGAVVLGRRDQSSETVVDRALATASEALGRSLVQTCVVVHETGKIVLEVKSSSGEKYLLRLGAGSAKQLIKQSSHALASLAEARPPPVVRDRIVWPLCEGEIGTVQFSIEQEVWGYSPRRMSPALWDECIEFLITLHSVGRTGETAGQPKAWAELQRSVDVLATNVGVEHRSTLYRLEQRLCTTLGQLQIGWVHGDYWLDNIIARDGRLTAVVDWDWARPQWLPLFDLLDLLSPGPPAIYDYTWVGKNRHDRRVSRYAEALGLGNSPEVLDGLVIAYWLDRVARELAPSNWQSHQSGWIKRNIHNPLRNLRLDGWG
jgi:hypothetical protein